MALLTESWKVDTFVLLIGAFTIMFWFLKRKYSYWERMKFKTLPDYAYILGHFNKFFKKRIHISEFISYVYKSTDEPFIGIYGLLRPIWFVRDPELIRSILIKDFSFFPDREYCTNFKIHYLI